MRLIPISIIIVFPLFLFSCIFSFADTPSEGFIVFSSNRSGKWRIWKMNIDGTNQIQLSGDDHEAIMPTISPDGRWIAYMEARKGYAPGGKANNVFFEAFWIPYKEVKLNTTVINAPLHIWLIRQDGTGEEKVVYYVDASSSPIAPAWGKDGFYYMKDGKIYYLDPDNKTSKIIHDISDFSKVRNKNVKFEGITHDGRWIVAFSNMYRFGYEGDNGRYYSSHSIIVLDVQNRDKVYFFGPGCESTTPPAGSYIYHIGNHKAPNSNYDGSDIMSMHIDEITKNMNSRITYQMEIGYREKDWGHEYWPRISTDNEWLVYGASTGDHDHYIAQYEIFIHRLGDGKKRKRLTNNNATDNWPHLWVNK